MLAPYGPGAQARIGVTSATDGDPLGKPPQENERVLRIGIDVQANEVVTTKANDRAHLVFLDGTSVTVGPNAQLTLDKFVYDPDTKKGELAINATKGVFRIVGGRISKTNAIKVTTPSSTIGIRGGIAIFNVSNTQTVSTFVFGSSLTVNGAGATQTITRPGSQVVTNFGGTPGNPTPVPRGSLTGSLSALEGTTGGTGGTPGNNPDQQSQNSGFSGQNSGQGPQNTTTTTAITSSTTSSTTTNAVSNSGQSNSEPPTVTTIDKTKTTETKTTTKTIVTYGRFLEDKPYLQATFNPNTLSAARDPGNNQALDPTGQSSTTSTTTTETTTTTQTKGGAVVSQTSTSTSNTVTDPTLATISSPGPGTSNAGGGDAGGSLTVPWLPGQIFEFNVDTSFGPANGLGLVAGDEKIFAYTFLVVSGANSGKKFLVFGGTPTARYGAVGHSFPKQGVGAQTLTSLSSPGNLPFAPDAVGGDAGLKAAANVSPLYSVYTPNLNGHGTAVPDALQVSIAFSGNNTTQKSYMGVFISNYGTDSATNTVYGAGTFMDSYRLGANQRIGRGISYQATADTGTGNAIYGDTGQYQVYVPDKVTTTGGGGHHGHHGHYGHPTTTRVPGAALDQAAANQAPTPYYPVTMATPVADTSSLPSDLGQNRTTQAMGGYVGGLVESRNGNTFKTRIPLLSTSPTDVSISTNAATNQAMGTIVLRGLDGSLLSKTTLELGGKSGANGPASAFIDDSRYAMITQTNDPYRKSKVQNLFHTYNITDNTMLASYKTAPAALPGGVQPCTCEYLSWGFWSSNINYSGGYRNGQTDNVNLGSYVVGQLTTSVQMPHTGSATYNGFMIGNVQNGNNAYVGTGNYQMGWNYAARAGTFGATFDGTNYAGGVVATNRSGTNFGGLFANGNLSRIGALTGSFFGPQAQNQGGAFTIGTNGSSYKASGIFAGQR
jgi:hypothetical protein